MVQTADHVEWIVAKNEVEAFFLEFNLIQRHKPRFNIRLKVDKSYLYPAVSLLEDSSAAGRMLELTETAMIEQLGERRPGRGLDRHLDALLAGEFDDRLDVRRRRAGGDAREGPGPCRREHDPEQDDRGEPGVQLGWLQLGNNMECDAVQRGWQYGSVEPVEQSFSSGCGAADGECAGGGDEYRPGLEHGVPFAANGDDLQLQLRV